MLLLAILESMEAITQRGLWGLELLRSLPKGQAKSPIRPKPFLLGGLNRKLQLLLLVQASTSRKETANGSFSMLVE
jgi:hypothetical protein